MWVAGIPVAPILCPRHLGHHTFQREVRKLMAPAQLPVLLLVALVAVVGARELSAGDEPRVSGAPRQLALGAAVDWSKLREPGDYQDLFLAHYSSLTPENEMKMEALAPTRGNLDFSEADALVRWAEEHGIAVHGHVLVWHRQLPAWLTQASWTPAELRSYLQRYVTEVVRHFRGRVESWDVVNEPLRPDGTPRSSIWRRVLGDGYIADALRWAHEADPGARLYVNEFDLERPGPKSRAMYRLLAGLVREGVPLDGIGLQAHLTPQWRPTGRQLRRVMRRYAGLGLRVDISEMDVAIGPGDAALAEQARIYRMVARACRVLPECGRFATWGFTDASTWLGTAQRPLPFSETGAAKPAWTAIAAELGPSPSR
jgi:endo-1,4-beta-xylanase